MSNDPTFSTEAFRSGTEVHIWHTDLRPSSDSALEKSFLALLDERETERVERFTAKHARDQNLTGRAVLRLLLAQYLEETPAKIRLVQADGGKPELAGENPLGLQFNITHKPGMVAWGFACGHRIGIDVEALDATHATTAIAERFFAAPEIERMRELSGEEAVAQFYKYWTLKEAYIKALGLGMKLPLKDFWFSLGDPDAQDYKPADINIAFSEDLDDDPARWCFFSSLLGKNHRISAAIESGKRAEPAMIVRPLPPLEQLGLTLS